jgi:hypothetical protein
MDLSHLQPRQHALYPNNPLQAQHSLNQEAMVAVVAGVAAGVAAMAANQAATLVVAAVLVVVELVVAAAQAQMMTGQGGAVSCRRQTLLQQRSKRAVAAMVSDLGLHWEGCTWRFAGLGSGKQGCSL